MKKVLSWIILLTFTVLIFTISPAPVQAAVSIYVAANGNDTTGTGSISSPYATIQKGLTMAQSGDTVYVRGGNYNGVCNISGKSGTSSQPITVRNYNDETPVINGDGYIRLLSCNYIIVTGLEFTGGTDSISSKFVIAGGDHNTFNNNYVHDNSTLDANIVITDSNYNTISNNRSYYGSCGIQITGTDEAAYNIIENNDCSWNDANGGNSDGISVICIAADNPVHHNIVRNNTCHDNTDDGIDLYTPHYSLAYGNVCYHNGYDRNGYTEDGYNGNGFKLGGEKWGSYGGLNLAVSNIAYGNKATGFTNNGGSGTDYIFNNTAYDNGDNGLETFLDYGGPSLTYFKNNISLENFRSDLYNLNQTGFSSHDLLGTDPSFVNAAGGNFHLQSGSAAINHGVTTTTSDIASGFTSGQPSIFTDAVSYALSHDKDGNVRSNYDAGAYECIAPTPTPTPTPTAGILFTDSFEDGNSTGWSVSGGTWSVVDDGSKVYRQTATSGTNCLAYAGSSSWADQSVQARVKILSVNGTDRPVGLTARFADSLNYYRFALRSSNQLEIKKFLGGSGYVLATKTFTVNTGTWYTLRLEVIGSSINAYVNGALELSTTDSDLATGRIGAETYYASAEFDDFAVTDPTP